MTHAAVERVLVLDRTLRLIAWVAIVYGLAGGILLLLTLSPEIVYLSAWRTGGTNAPLFFYATVSGASGPTIHL